MTEPTKAPTFITGDGVEVRLTRKEPVFYFVYSVPDVYSFSVGEATVESLAVTKDNERGSGLRIIVEALRRGDMYPSRYRPSDLFTTRRAATAAMVRTLRERFEAKMKAIEDAIDKEEWGAA